MSATSHKNLLNEAIELLKRGNLTKAETILKQYLKENPKNPEAWFHLGLIAHKVKSYSIAVALYNKAIKIKPEERYFLSQGLSLYELKDYPTQINCYRTALKIFPQSANIYSNIGVAFEKLKKSDEAIKHYKKALEINPNFAEAYSNLGVLLKNQDKFDEAMECYLKAMSINPNHPNTLYNIGIAYKDKKDLNKAIECYLKTIELNPRYMDAYLNLGIAYLLNKNFEEGWKYYEHRFDKLKKPAPSTFTPKPKWQGERLDNKTIYVIHEQGIGDTIQFVRFLPMLKQMGAKEVLFKPQPELEKLLKLNEDELDVKIISYLTSDDSLDFDVYIPLLSLPYCLKLYNEESFAANKYLKADENQINTYKNDFFTNDKFKIGIFWQGNPTLPEDKNRSFSPELFKPLFEIPNIAIYSLQKGAGQEQIKDLPKDCEVIDLGSTFEDFLDTAAALENLDLVITCDTAVAHLAGALKKMTWIILPTRLEWRWCVDGEKSAWYNNVTLFRPETSESRVEIMNKIVKKLRQKTFVK